MVHWQSVAASLVVFLGYNGANIFLAWFYYQKHAADATQWKIQPHKKPSGVGVGSWWFPVLDMFRKSRKPRHPYHAVFATINICMASVMFGVLAEFCVREQTLMYFDKNISPLVIAGEVLLQLLVHIVEEYWWHRLMHIPSLYKRFHKYHHYNKSPEPFDDMLIHPLEAFGYYCILYSPPLVMATHVYSFSAYMVILGVCGVLDHSGVKVHWLLYSTEDHDIHHEKFDVNYGFPVPWMDIIHQTYTGSYLGVEYKANKSQSTQPGDHITRVQIIDE